MTTTITTSLSQTPNDLFGESLIVGEAVASKMRREFLNASVSGHKQFWPISEILQALKNLSLGVTPILAESFWGSEMSSWLSAFEWNANRLPNWLQQHLVESGGNGIAPPDARMFQDSTPQRIRFPKLEKAATSLLNRGVMQRDEFDMVSDAAKAKAFTVAGDITDDTINRVRETLADLTVQGPTLSEFRETLRDKLNTGLLGPAHVETVYRTNLQAAYRDGRESILANPIVSSVFPYQEYLPINDGRVRTEHLALAKLGLDGTGIYRRDDPFWDRFTPPNGFNCRCGTNLLTLEAAARKGVVEAQLWIETGVPPRQPEFRNEHIPFEPTPGFGQRHGVLVA